MNRREFGILVGSGLLTACVSQGPRPTEPTTALEPTVPTQPQTKTLLAALLGAGYNATTQRVGLGTLIVINNSTRWNFKVNDQFVGIGAPVDPPSLNLADLIIPLDAKLSVVSA